MAPQVARGGNRHLPRRRIWRDRGRERGESESRVGASEEGGEGRGARMVWIG